MDTLTPLVKRGPAGWLVLGCGLIIVLIPFHAFLTVSLSGIFGHYTALRLWKEVLLVVLVGLVCWLVIQKRVRLPPVNYWSIIGLAYVGLCLVSAGLAYLRGTATPLAAAYGLLLDVRFVVFFTVCWLAAQQSDYLTRHWQRLVLVPAVIVIIFGLLQFFILPPNFLSHFGYGAQTIPAVQTVDQKQDYQRIQSTLRGANPLGAYLIIIVSAAAGLVLVAARSLRYKLLFVSGLAALALTFSRSAWLGALAALAWLLMYELVKRPAWRRPLGIAALAIVLVMAGTAYGLRSNDVFQNTFLHTDEHSRSAVSSNQGHLSAAREGLRDVAAAPIIGSGAGSAGPASAYNGPIGQPARIAENYFIQQAQESGLVGLLLFLLVMFGVARRLWHRRQELLPRVLLASLVGISLVNLLSHAWTDDTLCYLWWGLAGAALASGSILERKHHDRADRPTN